MTGEATIPATLMLTWRDAMSAGPARCGGKGYNLGRLSRYGFQVPEGGVLSAEAYRLSMQDDARRTAMEEGRTFELPESVRADLRTFLDAERLADAAVAVRSSATAEDSSRASFAGIHRSVLNVRGLEAIERAIATCYSSLWTPQARAYRARMGFADDEVACAVVICRMIASDAANAPRCAGVAFSADPRSGRRDVIVIDAVAGPGEDAVSGRVNPQRFVYRITQGGPVLHESPSAPALLSPGELRELAWTVHRIHWALGDGQDPQDIEWAHDGERLWILQARPITALPRGGPEALRQIPQYWSRGNVKDSVPGVPCELSWSGLHELVSEVAFAAAQVAGYRRVEGLELVRRFRGRVYFDFTLLQWTFYDAFGVTPDVSVRSVGGHQPLMEVPPGDPMKGADGRRRRLASLRLLRALWGFERTHTPLFRRHIDDVRTLAREPLVSKTNDELRATLASLDAKQHALATPAGLANSAYGRWFLPLEHILTRAFGARGGALTAALSSGSDEITSAEQGYRVNDLAGLAQGEPAALAWLHSSTDPHSWKAALPPDSPFRLALQRFLDEFGHRATVETDATVPRWVEDPSTLLAMIRTQLAMPAGPDPRARARDRYRAAEADIRTRRPSLSPAVRWIARRLRRAYAIRELAKSALVAGLLPTRQLVLEVGRRLTEAGHLETREQAFDLTAAELRAWLAGLWDGRGAGELAVDRRRRREAWLREEVPEVIAGDGGVLPAAPLPRVPAAGAWHGIAASSGRAVGIARIILRPEDGDRLTHGDILVAPSTDPGWTPLFIRASAVVMETGGYLSHGAIVAREYGLPAVVNIPGLLDQVHDGDVLDVDGDAGTVVKEERGKTEDRNAP